MIRSFSVIVPVLNKENEIIPTLQSIEASIAYFQQRYRGEAVTAEIVVVNEGSSDRTLELVTHFAQHKPYYQIISHFKSLGIGSARNTGAKVARGDLLFFFDGDDLMFPPHIYLCFRVLNHHPNRGAESAFSLECAHGTEHITLPPTPVAMIRTGACIQESLHPSWKQAVENTIMQNFAIRRECHEFIEGFPESPVYKQLRCCEDIAYNFWAVRFFKLYQIRLETVEYIRYPGNALDRQLKKFQTPPEEYQDDHPPEQQVLRQLRLQIEREQLTYLLNKFKHQEANLEFSLLLNPIALANEYLTRQDYAAAIAVAEQGLIHEPHWRAELVNLLAVAYNNLGSTYQQQKQYEAAANCFQRAIASNPQIAPTDLARVCFNAAISLREQGKFAEALPYLQRAVELDPSFAAALTELPRLHYQAHMTQAGYEWSQPLAQIDSYLKSLELLTSHLTTPSIQPIRILQLGGGDGQLTCWLVDHLLTANTAKLLCLDPAPLPLWQANVAKTTFPHKVKSLSGVPQVLLRALVPDSYHLICFTHPTQPSEQMELLCLLWGLLQIGGLLLVEVPLETSTLPPKPAPQTAVEAFINLFAPRLKVLSPEHWLVLQKVAP